MEVGDQRAHVAGAVGPPGGVVVHLHPVDVALHALGPLRVVALVGAVDATARGGADVGVGEQELTDARLVGEAVHAIARRVDEHRARAVQDVAGAQLAPARLQHVLVGAAARAREPRQDREDRADVHVRVDVGRAVEWIEVHDIATDRHALGHLDDVLVLLGRDHGQLTRAAEHAHDRLVREDVQLLDLLALHVDRAGGAEHVREPRADDGLVDHLRGQRDIEQQAGELPTGLGMLSLLLEHELRQGDRAIVHEGVLRISPTDRSRPRVP